MTAVQPGQLYHHNKTGKQVIVRRVVRSATDSPAYRPYSGFPEALIESCDDGPLRPRWVRLAVLHTDGKPRRSGYSLKTN